MAARQSASIANDASSTKILVTFPSTVASGSAIVGYVTWGTAVSTDFISVGDEKSGASSFTLVDRVADAPNNQCLGSFYKLNVTSAASSITASFDIGVTFRTLLVNEYINISTVTALDKNHMILKSAPGTGANAIATSTMTTGTNGELIYSGVIDTTTGSLATVATGTGYTIVQTNSSATVHMKTEGQTQGTAGGIAGTWTDGTHGGTDSYIVGMMAFKPSTVSATAQRIVYPWRAEFASGVFANNKI